MDAASVREGTLITCDVPTRELILHLNETHNFLLERLDETTLLIDSSFSHIVEAELGKTLERHVFSSRHLFAHEKERPLRERRDRHAREPRDPDGTSRGNGAEAPAAGSHHVGRRAAVLGDAVVACGCMWKRHAETATWRARRERRGAARRRGGGGGRRRASRASLNARRRKAPMPSRRPEQVRRVPRARFRACEALRLAAPPSRDAPPAAAVADTLSSIDLGLHGECGAASEEWHAGEARVGGRAPSSTSSRPARTCAPSTQAARTASSKLERKAYHMRCARRATACLKAAVGRVSSRRIYAAAHVVLGRGRGSRRAPTARPCASRSTCAASATRTARTSSTCSSSRSARWPYGARGKEPRCEHEMKRFDELCDKYADLFLCGLFP